MLLNKESYIKYSSLVDRKELKENNRELSYLYAVLDSLALQIPGTSFSVDELEASFWAQYPEASHEIYDGLFHDLHAINISDAVGEEVLASISRKKLSLRLSEAAFKLSSGAGSLEEVKELVEALNVSAVSAPLESFESVTTDLEVLANNAISKPGLRWRLDCLNKSLGSLRKGDFGFIFARPESGKTTLLASEASNMVNEATSPIIWFSNRPV